MPQPSTNGHANGLHGHARRDARLRRESLDRARSAPPLAQTIVRVRAGTLGMTRLEFARLSGISRGTLRDLELGLHLPTRRTLGRFLAFCQRQQVNDQEIEELRRLYAGEGGTLAEWIARLELLAGSPRDLARRVGISPATLWEYRRGNYPLPIGLLRRLCEAVGAEAAPAEALWHEAERRRLLGRGYPEALAEFWVRCARRGYAERHLRDLGLGMATVRRLRYLELPPWEEVAPAFRQLCESDAEFGRLQQLWRQDEAAQPRRLPDPFGAALRKLRQEQGVGRRELADLFGVGGKKPARIIKYVEEDGFYSAQAYPAGLAALLAPSSADADQLLALWQRRRGQFHRRHRPETRTDLRLAREAYGFTLADLEPVLGYPSAEYQRIERGVLPLAPSARARILEAIHRAGRHRVEALRALRGERAARREAWRSPPSVAALVALLAEREGGLIPLTRLLRHEGLKGLWTGRLRAIAQGREVPPWPVLEQIAEAAGVGDRDAARRDWLERYRALLQKRFRSPLGVELRLFIAETAGTLRAFSQRLAFNYSVLVRDLHRLDRDVPVRWFHVERILRAAGVPPESDRWREVHALWYTATDRKPSPPSPRPRATTSLKES